MKVAIVGCGKIADAHVEEVRKIPNAEVIAVCDREPLMAEQLSVRYKIPFAWGDFETMLRESRPDVVHITTPPQSHLALTAQAVAAGCHVFLEKPVALDLAEAEAIVAVAEKAGRLLAVNYWPQFERQAIDLDRLWKSGVLGDPVHLESFYGYNLAGEYGTAIKNDPQHWVRRMPGKLYQNVLDHVLNKIVPFLDTDYPGIQVESFSREPGSDLPDELRVMIRGIRVTAYATFSSHARPVGHTLRVYGTRGTAHADWNARTVVLEGKQSFPSALGRLFPTFATAKAYLTQGMKNLGAFRRYRFGYFDGMRVLLEDFYRAIEQGGASPTPAHDILLVASLMEEIFRQAAQVEVIRTGAEAREIREEVEA